MNIGFFVSDDCIQMFFGLKEVKIKMSSLLNATSQPEEFSPKDIKVLLINEEQNWLKRAQLWKFLGIEDIRASLNGLEKFEILTRQELILTQRGTIG